MATCANEYRGLHIDAGRNAREKDFKKESPGWVSAFIDAIVTPLDLTPINPRIVEGLKTQAITQECPIEGMFYMQPRP